VFVHSSKILAPSVGRKIALEALLELFDTCVVVSMNPNHEASNPDSVSGPDGVVKVQQIRAGSGRSGVGVLAWFGGFAVAKANLKGVSDRSWL
jgi:hypothetical protein